MWLFGKLFFFSKFFERKCIFNYIFYVIVPRTTPSHHSRENKPIFSDAIASAYVAYVITSQINKIHCPFNQFRRSIDRSNRNKQLCSCNKIEIKNKSKTHWSNSCQFQTKQINKKAQETQKRTEILWHFCDIQKIYLPCRKKKHFWNFVFFFFRFEWEFIGDTALQHWFVPTEMNKLIYKNTHTMEKS